MEKERVQDIGRCHCLGAMPSSLDVVRGAVISISSLHLFHTEKIALVVNLAHLAHL